MYAPSGAVPSATTESASEATRLRRAADDFRAKSVQAEKEGDSQLAAYYRQQALYFEKRASDVEQTSR